MLRLQSVTVVIVMMLFSARMAKPEVPSADANKLVIEALQCEMDGDASSRQALLNRALKRDPKHAPARWHTGHVRHNGKWVRIDLLPQLSASTETPAEYRRMRDTSPKSYRGQLELANWCRRNNLPEQERAHLTAAAVISGSLNDRTIRSRLGFVLANGRWQLRSEIQDAKKAARAQQRAFKYWTPRLKRIARGLNHLTRRERCVVELRGIDDPDALPAMEAVFSNRDLSAVLVLLDAYDNMNTHLAAVALARQAIYSPWKTVRESAAKKLKSRPPEAYAPVMLASLHTPISSHLKLYIGNAGVRITQAFSREHQDFKQLAVLDSQTLFANQVFAIPVEQTRNNRAAFNRNSKRRAVENAVIDAKLNAYGANRRVEIENDATKKLNERIMTALSTATRVQLPADSQAWWQWWLDYNELYSDQEKPCRYVCLHEETAELVPMMAMPSSCLSAGTLIWTDRGPIAVETVQVGDLVLAKHPESGELAYKPVLRTTVRPARQLLKVGAGETVFNATGGHAFWISGHGWQKIRDVKPGMRFHGATGPTVLDSLEEGDKEPTYNLVVADFHTYFVGQSKLLSHDPTFAQPTDLLVPGLHER